MRLTILGLWSPYPRAGGASPSYLVEQGDTRILLDCGNGSLGKLQEVCDFRTLTAVVISHYHPDHYYDLFSLRHAIWGSQRDGSRPEPLPVYLPKGPEEKFKALSKFEGVFQLQTIEGLAQGGETQGSQHYHTQVGSLYLEFCPTLHPLPTYAVAIKGHGSMVYSSDTAWSDAIIDFAQGTDLFLCEASLLEQDKEHTKLGHLTAGQAGQIGSLAGVNRLVLTHFFPEYDLTMLQGEASKAFGRPVDIAVEGKSYLITG